MRSHKEIEEAAAHWLARRDGDEWTPADQEQLMLWINAATAHRVAYLRLEAAWEEARRLKVFGAGLPPRTVPPTGSWRESPYFEERAQPPQAFRTQWLGRSETLPRRSPFWRFAATAASAIVAAAGLYLWHSKGDLRYSTPVGGMVSVPLHDGSNVTLNTDSQVNVDLGLRERHVELNQGEAFFVVAKDPRRPFVVHAGNKAVTAVGTQFSVRREDDELRIVVTEGVVAVTSDAGKRAAGVTRLPAGSIARVIDGDILVEDTSMAHAEELLSWREGFLTFHETALADVINEFNRYNQHRMSIADPKVAAIRISGTFRPTNHEAFVRLLEQGFAIRARSTADVTVLAGE